MVNWQEVGRVISAVHHHGQQGLKTSEIQKLVRQQTKGGFNFKEALDEAVRTGFLRVKNRRFYPCNWQEMVSTRKRGPRLPRGKKEWGRDSCADVVLARRRSSSRSGRRRQRSKTRATSARKRPSRSYARRRNTKTRGGNNSSNSRRRRRSPPRSQKLRRKASRSRGHQRSYGHRHARAGSDEKISSDGNNRVTPA